jgi:hypothetical protein
MKINKNFRTISLLFVITLLSVFTSCQTESVGDGNGLNDPSAISPAFTITPDTSDPNKFSLSAEKSGLASRWEISDGRQAFIGKSNETISLPDAGTYTIKHIAIGIGGKEYVETKEIVVATSDPNAGNLIKGGKFANASDYAKWSRLIFLDGSGNPVQNARWTFAPGSATINSSGWEQQGLYQAINVVKDKKYQIQMNISGAGGAVNTWFEVYADKTVPVIKKSGDDYSFGGAKLKVTTWCDGLKKPFNGKFTDIDCDTKVKGLVSFPETGVIYLVIRSGGENAGPSGITIKNVEFRGTK